MTKKAQKILFVVLAAAVVALVVIKRKQNAILDAQPGGGHLNNPYFSENTD
jgi:hypothetical protein